MTKLSVIVNSAHLNRGQIESNFSVPGIRGCHKNALYKSFKTSPNSIGLYSVGQHQYPFRPSLNPDLIQRLALKGS